MKVLVACEYSGRVREAFRKLGHDAWSCDILPSEDNSDFHFEGDVMQVIKSSPWDLITCSPAMHTSSRKRCATLCTQARKRRATRSN